MSRCAGGNDQSFVKSPKQTDNAFTLQVKTTALLAQRRLLQHSQLYLNFYFRARAASYMCRILKVFDCDMTLRSQRFICLGCRQRIAPVKVLSVTRLRASVVHGYLTRLLQNTHRNCDRPAGKRNC